MMHQVPGLNTTTGASDLVRLKEEKVFGINTWDVLFQFFLPQFDSINRYYHEQQINANLSQAGIETKISYPVKCKHRQASRYDILSCGNSNITGRHRDKDFLSCD
jgi:hypothetical protein